MFQFQESGRQSRAFGEARSRSRSGRRNDKFLSIWQNLFPEQPKAQKKTEARKSDSPRAETRKAAVTNSPITFIKMPAAPYTFQSGVGFVSPPSQFPILSFLGGLGASSPKNEQQRSAAEPKIDAFDESDRSSDSNSGSGLFQQLISSESKPLLKRHDDNDVHADAEEADVDDINDVLSPSSSSSSISDTIKNFLQPQEKDIIRPDIKFVSNGKPFNLFQLGSTLFKTTEPTTTTTTTTTTEDESEAVTESSSDEKSESPITWLGKFMINGLPTKIFDFKSPFANLDWVDSLRQIPATNLFMSLFK